jgi:hypothetical protein
LKANVGLDLDALGSVAGGISFAPVDGAFAARSADQVSEGLQNSSLVMLIFL